MKKFGVWYDDGRLDFGWLAYEGRHGRSYSLEVPTLEEAQEIADREAQYDKETVFYAADKEADHTEMFKTVRKIVNRRKLEKAERDLKHAKAAVAGDDEDTRKKFERALDDD